MEQQDLLKEVGKILNELKIPYSITGGMAIAVWGRPRFTAGIDVIVELFSENLGQLARRLLQIDKDVYVDERMMQRALERHGEFNFIHPASGLKVDFWILKNEPYAKEQIRRRISKTIDGTKVYFVSPEDLILSKLRWHQQTGSELQLRDIKSVIQFQKKLDWKYLRKWSTIQGTQDILNELRKKNKQ